MRRGRAIAIACTAIAACGLVLPLAAHAQGWSWPWESNQPPPIPREPMNRPPAAIQPAPGYPPGPQTGARSSSAPICLQLEQRLAQEANRGSQNRDLLPQDRGRPARCRAHCPAGARRSSIAQDCFDYFLFSKTLKRTRACVDLNTQVESARRRVAELDTQRQQLIVVGRAILPGRHHPRARPQQLRRRLPAGSQPPRARSRRCGRTRTAAAPPAASSATCRSPPTGRVCVRLCDGYYFPVSFSTLPNHFERDADVCQSKCAAPAELYYHQNPGSGMEQAVSYKTQAALHEPAHRLPLPQGIRAGLLVQAGGVHAEHAAARPPRRRGDAGPGQPAAPVGAMSRTARQ